MYKLVRLSLNPTWILTAYFLLFPVTLYATDFGISVGERSVTTDQYPSPPGLQQLKIHRKDFEGPINVELSVSPSGQGVDAHISHDKPLKGGTKTRSETDIDISTSKYAENGTYTVTVTATGTIKGEKRTRVATFQVIVKRKDTFNIAVNPPHLVIPMGSVGSTIVEIVESADFNNRVYLNFLHIDGFGYNFTGDGEFDVVKRSDLFSNAKNWIVTPNKNGTSTSKLTITTFPDTVPGEYIFYVYGTRDETQNDLTGKRQSKTIKGGRINTRRALLRVTVTEDPSFIELIEPVEFSIYPEKPVMVTPPAAEAYMNDIYVNATRSLETIKFEASLSPKAAGISIGLNRTRRLDQIKGPNTLFVAVKAGAKPGKYIATIKATSRGTNNKELTKETQVEIIVPDIKKPMISRKGVTLGVLGGAALLAVGNKSGGENNTNTAETETVISSPNPEPSPSTETAPATSTQNGNYNTNLSVASNPGNHPILLQQLTLFLDVVNASIIITQLTNNPNFPSRLTGTISSDGSFTANGNGTYSGFSTLFQMAGTLLALQQNLNFILNVGGNGSLPTGQPISYNGNGTKQ